MDAAPCGGRIARTGPSQGPALRRDDEEEQGGARVLLPEGLPPVLNGPGAGEGGAQEPVGQTARHVGGRRETGRPGWLPGKNIAHDGV